MDSKAVGVCLSQLKRHPYVGMHQNVPKCFPIITKTALPYKERKVRFWEAIVGGQESENEDK